MSIVKFVTFLCGNGVEDISHFILVPWLASYIAHAVDESWVKSVFHYGVVLSVVSLGRVIGWILGALTKQEKPRYPLFFLIIGFMGLSISTRLSLILLFSLLIGLGGSVMGSKDSHLPTATSTHLENLDASGKLVTNISAGSQVETRQDVTTQRKIIVCVFIALLSGLTYDEESMSPARGPCYIGAAWSAFVLLIRTVQLWMQQDKFNLKKRFKKSFLASKSPTKTATIPRALDNNSSHSSLPPATSVAPARPTNNHPPKSMDGHTIKFDKLPEAFLTFHNGDMTAAKEAYARTLKWRRERRMDSLFEQPQPFFHEILQYYPHAIHGRSREGAVVLYEVLGQMKPQELSQLGKNDFSYIWQVISGFDCIFIFILKVFLWNNWFGTWCFATSMCSA